MSYILIITVVSLVSRGHVQAVTMGEFSDRVACETAARTMDKFRALPDSTVTTICVPKSSRQNSPALPGN